MLLEKTLAYLVCLKNHHCWENKAVKVGDKLLTRNHVVVMYIRVSPIFWNQNYPHVTYTLCLRIKDEKGFASIWVVKTYHEGWKSFSWAFSNFSFWPILLLSSKKHHTSVKTEIQWYLSKAHLIICLWQFIINIQDHFVKIVMKMVYMVKDFV